MLPTSELYKRLLSEEHTTEVSLVIGTSGVLTTEEGDAIIFGSNNGENIRILVEQGGPDDGFTQADLFELKTYHQLFDGETPLVGCTVAGQIEASLLLGDVFIPRMADMVPYVRLISADGTEKSEWVKKGIFYVDTREVTHNDGGLNMVNLKGYDALLKAQADYPSDNSAAYPKTDRQIVTLIAKAMGVDIDPRTLTLMNGNYTYGLEVMAYSMQEVLSSIAVPYAGNWIMSDEGMLRLVSLAEIPKETRLLTDEIGYAIIFGTENGQPSGDPVRILV